ncbi:hypothetical protein ACSSV1_006238 [Labrenzia sp. MBR-25]
MDWYYGTDQQIRLQKIVDERTNWCAETKGAVNGGRFLGTDDYDALGWDRVIELIKDHGAFTFRMIPVETLDEFKNNLSKHDIRFDSWNVFSADSDKIEKHAKPLTQASLPDGYTLINEDELSDVAVVSEIQECMSRSGVVPYTGRLLAGLSVPSVTIAIRDDCGKIVGTAFGYYPYNQYSRWSSTAWGGLVSIDESQRGKRLGLLINALMVWGCVEKLGAQAVQEYAAATNEPSRRMIERSGLRLDPSIVCGIATTGSARFTA